MLAGRLITGSHVIPGQRKGTGSVFHTHKGVCPRAMDFAGRLGNIKGTVKDIVCDPGCRLAPLMKVVFYDPYPSKKQIKLRMAAEGIPTGFFVYCSNACLRTPCLRVPTGCCLRDKLGQGQVGTSLQELCHSNLLQPTD